MRFNKLLVPLAFSMLFSSGVAVAALSDAEGEAAIEYLKEYLGYYPKITNYTLSTNGAIHHVTVAHKNLNQISKLRCVIKMNGNVVGVAEDIIKGVGTLDIFISGGTPDTTEAQCEVLQIY